MEKLDLLKLQEQFCLSLNEAGKSFNTIKNYKTDLNIFNQFLLSKGRKLSLTEVTSQQLKEYGRYLDKKYNSPNSIRRRVQALRIFFDYLISQNFYSENPVKKMVVSPKVVDIPRPPSFHSILQVHEFLTEQAHEAQGHTKLLYLRNLILIHLIYGGGLKVSDIENIKSPHIKKAKSLYRVLVVPDKKEPYMVSMNEVFSSIHEEYQELMKLQKSKNQIDFDDYLFNGNPYRILRGGLSSRGIEITFKELSKKLDTKLTAKSLRQACILKWINMNKVDSRIKELMGVQPQYSLAPYKKLISDEPEKFCYMELK